MASTVMTSTPSASTSALRDVTQGKSSEEVTQMILDFEKRQGIDWVALLARGEEGWAEGVRLSRQRALRVLGELEQANVAFPSEIRTLLEAASNGIDMMPCWALSPDVAATWTAAQGSSIKSLVKKQIANMQTISGSSSAAGITELSISIGVTAWCNSAYVGYVAARTMGTGVFDAVMAGVTGVGAVATAAVVVVLLAVLLPIFILMEKDAIVYMVLLNRTRQDLTLKGSVHNTHGKQLVQFTNSDGDQKQIPACHDIFNDQGTLVETVTWMGFFMAQKKDSALYGSQGAFLFEKGEVYPSGASIGWEIPLSGSNNRCLVAADTEKSAKDFSTECDNHGTQNQHAGAGTSTIDGRMNAHSGSEGYMAVVFNTKAA